VLAGTCKLYLAPRPIAQPSIAATAENTSLVALLCAVRCGCSHLRLVAFMLTPRVMIHNHACPPQDQSRAPRNDANVRRKFNNMYAHAIYHLASALCASCMHDLFGRSRLLVHQPREDGRPESLSGEPRDLRSSILPTSHSRYPNYITSHIPIRMNC